MTRSISSARAPAAASRSRYGVFSMCQNGRPGFTLSLPQQLSIRIFLPPIWSSQLCTLSKMRPVAGS